MTQETHLSELEEEMAQAVASEDFETASALRDQIDQIRRDQRIMEQPGADAPQASYLRRQEPGKMGLGTDQPRHVPPRGWVPPAKPDPMTTGHSKGGRRSRG
ncbi:UvrB/UvrC motif-containing protein [Caulobacter sp. UNC279MFTsu5.1]|uniref:UvrB/UvrC motif-containing protein n=1 Tax=Caulobacter sp. UNC279MFTsu5.1 TaxID=1502775 RepID=UPI0008E62F85|nr:UvrB/UvrC motif-containing protein [Caulobacter sp. UNC279MFTsu5.1]SFJ83005.1 UvrB/uvrC motif-containing protein [Caulobacter sp. UNC279MFTsu5.1]